MIKTLTVAPLAPKSPRLHRAATALKALLLVAVVWGLAYPALLWGLGTLVG
jgi:hypothetical protein